MEILNRHVSGEVSAPQGRRPWGAGPPKRENARDRSLWRLQSNELAGYSNHASSRSALEWNSESPRIPHPPAQLTVSAGVAPNPRSVRRAFRWGLRAASNPAPSGSVDGECRGRPQSSLRPPHHRMWSSSFLESRTFRPRRPCVPRLPRVLHLRLGR